MKVAILSESPADQAAVHIFVNALLGQSAELHDFRVPPSGCSNVFKVLPAVISELQFNATDVDGLVVTVDSDLTTPHHGDHDLPGGADQTCRLCRLRQDIQRIRSQLSATAQATSRRRGFGYAVHRGVVPLRSRQHRHRGSLVNRPSRQEIPLRLPATQEDHLRNQQAAAKHGTESDG